MQFPAPGVGSVFRAQKAEGGTILPLVVNLYGRERSRVGVVLMVTLTDPRAPVEGAGSGGGHVTVTATVAVDPPLSA